MTFSARWGRAVPGLFLAAVALGFVTLVVLAGWGLGLLVMHSATGLGRIVASETCSFSS